MAADTRFVLPFQTVINAVGVPWPGAYLNFYVTGSSTRLDTYSDVDYQHANLNPVQADSGGMFPNIFLLHRNYKVVLTDADGDEIWTADPVAPIILNQDAIPITIVMECTVDGAGSSPTPGVCGDLYVPFDCEITKWVIQATAAGDIEFDVWAKPFAANNPPTIANSIVALAPPTMTASQGEIDATLVDWTTTIPGGTWVRFNLNSVATIVRATISLVATLPSP